MSTISDDTLLPPTPILCPTPSYPPFFDEHPFRIYEKILEGKIEWPKSGMMDPNAKDLIKKLLSRDMTSRLGSLKVGVMWGGVSVHVVSLQQGVADVKQHRWFRGVDWDAVLQRKLVVSVYLPSCLPRVVSCLRLFSAAWDCSKGHPCW